MLERSLRLERNQVAPFPKRPKSVRELPELVREGPPNGDKGRPVDPRVRVLEEALDRYGEGAQPTRVASTKKDGLSAIIWTSAPVYGAWTISPLPTYIATCSPGSAG